MAAPATHIILAKKFFDKYCPEKNEADFIRGTSFPDIRYIADIERHNTHTHNTTLSEIKTADAFTAGLKVHSLVDLTSSKYFKDSGIIELLPNTEYVIQILKTYVDILLYQKFSSEMWLQYTKYFDQLSNGELSFGIDEKVIQTWHKIIKETIISQPNGSSLITFFKNLHIQNPEEIVISTLEKLQQIEKIKEVTESYYQNFEQIVREEKG